LRSGPLSYHQTLKTMIDNNEKNVQDQLQDNEPLQPISKPSGAFVAASWSALIIGMSAFLIGLWNVQIEFNEKGYYLSILVFGLFSVISVQKSVRDQLEGIAVTSIYYGLSWFAVIFAIILLVAGLWNADIESSEKGFFAMSYVLSTFSAVAVQKNTRDTQALN